MRSRHADTFNHDADAPGYDADVREEAHPIRAGYAALLAWVARTADVRPPHRVLELGAGTGNLTTLLSPAADCLQHIVAVDISADMLAIARAKVSGSVTWVHGDLLAYFDEPGTPFDRVVSTYAIHHLTADEKRTLFVNISERLAPGGIVVFGDLMFESAAAQQRAATHYRKTGWVDVADAIDAEFFWLLDVCVPDLVRLGFRVETRRFSDLSWGIRAAL